MKRLLPVFSFWLMALGTSAMAQTTGFPEGAEPLTPQALQAALEGKSFKLTPAQGSPWRVQFNTNGYFFLNATRYNNSGKWSAKDSSMCQDTGKNTGCNEIRSKDGQLYLKRDSGEVVAMELQ